MRDSRTRSARARMSPPTAGATLATVSDAPILLCYDGSVEARRAIAEAAALLGGRRAVVLDIGPIQLVAEPHVPPDSGPAALEAVAADQAAARAGAGAEIAREAGFTAEAHAEIESPVWRSIVETADGIDAAAIVLGSRGLCGVRALLEGSVSRLVALHADRPVLVVPPAP
jgi:nucleotide-binding universal stress UspA family protein